MEFMTYEFCSILFNIFQYNYYIHFTIHFTLNLLTNVFI